MVLKKVGISIRENREARGQHEKAKDSNAGAGHASGRDEKGKWV